jgi:hypothetical protein
MQPFYFSQTSAGNESVGFGNRRSWLSVIGRRR